MYGYERECEYLKKANIKKILHERRVVETSYDYKNKKEVSLKQPVTLIIQEYALGRNKKLYEIYVVEADRYFVSNKSMEHIWRKVKEFLVKYFAINKKEV